MSVKEKATVERYTANVASLVASLQQLQEFVDSLPAPDENDHLPSPMDYGHTGTVGHVRELVEQAAQAAKNFWA